ncbi:unnamed protein product (macronuclear) [Paramecium tetraurelia]|uniref:EF-hand domain-containing protein n=2 Tax=Paramecium TaxID=5884 RepID=A0BXL7_PARTE|nr:uncharacterized protein GSPATT00033137001 [Paramecium tetraurelia]CAD8200509.1 unnamed protein product [Paramecium octaurelia]CAK63284.1 unnamed protein product [Paramecium tetraurelia]|eukprot:XP_001430682.1 hypothetical protein (macronuclear) [Paramecium tetraurelia strain d4-2]
MGQVSQKLFTTTEADEQIVISTNSRIGYIQKKFLFSQADVSNLHKIFRKMDTMGTGYISQQNFFEFLDEEFNSVVSPYIEYLFQLIEKEVEQKVSFSEWLPAISLYCLYTKDSVVAYVFQMLDSDHDNFISKKDLMNFLVQKRNGKKIFYYNYMKAVELLDIERPDKISLEQFRKIQQQIPFICYPAFRLQRELRSRIFGVKYWDSLYDRILHKENEENKQKQMQKIQDEMKRKQQNKLDKKVEKFLQNTHKSRVSMPSMKLIHQRVNGRRNSDTNMPQNQETADELINNMFQQISKQLKGQHNQRKQKELKVLRCRSKSLQYIKMNFKHTEEQVVRSSKYIKTQQSSQQIPLNFKKQERRSIFHMNKVKPPVDKPPGSSHNSSDSESVSQSLLY